MRVRPTLGTLAALALVLSGCGQEGTPETDGPGSGEAPEYTVAEDVDLADSPTWSGAKERGRLRIGVKFDQPGLANVEPGQTRPEGFDVEIAKLAAAGLGFADDEVEFVETVTPNREPFLKQGTVDMIVASYTINDERKEVIDFAGPYYITGQDFLVLEDSEIQSEDDLAGTVVCSVDASTSAMRIEEDYPDTELVTYDTYPKCLDDVRTGNADAMTTDDSILRGYAAVEDSGFRVLGEQISEEPYGIGLPKDEEELRNAVNDILEQAAQDGTWVDAFEYTLGDTDGVEQPEPERY
jgi:glutamate transport system substrate-binding protein